MSIEAFRLGYWVNKKKDKVLELGGVKEALRRLSIQLIEIDLKGDLEAQGPFDGILHKVTDLAALAEMGDNQAENILRRIEAYAKEHPEVVMINSLAHCRAVINRFKAYNLLQEAISSLGEGFYVPPFDRIVDQRDIEKSLTFPIIFKPTVSDGHKETHRMTVVFREDQMGVCPFPGVAQSFVNHDAVLYKVYFVGQQPFVVRRPSIKNLLKVEESPIQFYSKDVSKPPSWVADISRQVDVCEANLNLNLSTLQQLGNCIGSTLDLFLFGIDLAFEKDANRWAILDLNIFPSYGGVENHGEIIADFVLKLLQGKRAARFPVPFVNQVGGHKETAPLLRHSAGHLLKPFQDGGRGPCEAEFYEAMWNSSTFDPEVIQLRELIPRYYGTTTIGTQSYILFQNLVHNFQMPCIMDIKIGKETSDPLTSIEKRRKSGLKYAGTRSTLGLSLTGIQYFENGKMVHKNKVFGKSLTPETLCGAIDSFFGNRKNLVEICIEHVQKIQKWFTTQTKFAFYGSSILVIYDAAQVHNVDASPEWFCVKMVDFTHVFESVSTDKNYADGLDNFLKILYSISRSLDVDDV